MAKYLHNLKVLYYHTGILATSLVRSKSAKDKKSLYSALMDTKRSKCAVWIKGNSKSNNSELDGLISLFFGAIKSIKLSVLPNLKRFRVLLFQAMSSSQHPLFCNQRSSTKLSFAIRHQECLPWPLVFIGCISTNNPCFAFQSAGTWRVYWMCLIKSLSREQN